MGSLVLVSNFWSLNTILLIKIANFNFGGLRAPPGKEGGKQEKWAWVNIPPEPGYRWKRSLIPESVGGEMLK